MDPVRCSKITDPVLFLILAILQSVHSNPDPVPTIIRYQILFFFLLWDKNEREKNLYSTRKYKALRINVGDLKKKTKMLCSWSISLFIMFKPSYKLWIRNVCRIHIECTPKKYRHKKDTFKRLKRSRDISPHNPWSFYLRVTICRRAVSLQITNCKISSLQYF